MRWEVMSYAFARAISTEQAIQELAEEAVVFFEAMLRTV